MWDKNVTDAKNVYPTMWDKHVLQGKLKGTCYTGKRMKVEGETSTASKAKQKQQCPSTHLNTLCHALHMLR